MSKRSEYLRALHNESFDRLTWAPNFGYWLTVNTQRGTVPKPYQGLSRNDIVRAVGGTIWSRIHAVRTHRPDIPVTRRQLSENSWRETFHTAKGDLTQAFVVQGGDDHATVMHEHPVKTVDDLPALIEMVRATRFKIDPEPARRELEEVGEDGVVLEPCPCVPFIEFGKMDAGWETGLYMWYDHRSAVEEVLEAYSDMFIEQIRLTAEHSPARIIHLGDNMDQLTVSPKLFRIYALPYYRKVAEIVHAAGKLLEVHWCGRTRRLLPLLPGSGVDVVEAIVTEPMSDLSMDEALRSVGGQVVIQGGLPSVLMCPQGGSREDLIHYIRHITENLHPTRGFILGMGDNVPPDADFQRVRIVSDLVAEAYA